MGEAGSELKQDYQLSRLYAKFNRLYFDTRLPANPVVGWDSTISSDQWAWTIHDNIEGTQILHIGLNPDLKKLPSQFKRLFLLHEMAHVAIWPYKHHGKKFQEEMQRLAVRGAFKDVW